MQGLITAVKAVLVFCLLNLPFWVLAHWVLLARPIFNMDLLLPVAVAAFSVPVAYVLLLVLWGLDLVDSFSGTFYFPSLREAYEAVHFAPEVFWRHYLSAAAIFFLLLFGLCSLALLQIRGSRPRILTVVAIFAAALVVGDVVNGSSRYSPVQKMYFSVNISGTSAFELVQSLYQRRPSAEQLAVVADSATSRAGTYEWAIAHPSGGILLVLVESMGMAKDPDVRGWLKEQLMDDALARRYVLTESSVAFSGATTYGELRELCSLSGDFRLMTESAGEKCLPGRLKSLGWSTVGVHGFSRRMFAREAWWPMIGLNKRFFGEDMTEPEGRRCGGILPGACDADVVATAFKELAKPGSFVYVLTLNSHLPLKAAVLAPGTGACPHLNLEPDDCALIAAIGNVLVSIKAGLTQYNGAGPLVVVVGDHAPPYLRADARSRYSTKDVPAYILTPRI